jgi:hypothetical protein
MIRKSGGRFSEKIMLHYNALYTVQAMLYFRRR